MRSDSVESKIVTWLAVWNFDGEAQAITQLLRITPTETWREGDRVHPKAIIVRHERGWKKESPVDPLQTTPEESIAALLNVFPDLTAFQRLPPNSYVELGVALY